MRKLFIIAISIFMGSGITAQTKKYMNFQAEIANRNGDVISFMNDRNQLVKKIQVNKEGIFKDTMNVATGRYLFSDGKEYTIIYLKNGLDLKMKLDAKKFDETLSYTGNGAIENNFLAKNPLSKEQAYLKKLLNSSKEDFVKGMDQKKTNDLKRLDDKKLDPVFVDLIKKSINDDYNAITDYYDKNYEMNLSKNKLNNTIAPSFEYENHKGGKTKLEDFKGKYVYIDVWATWCGPCRAEIPALQAIEEKYKSKNIQFISISVDLDKDHEKWKTLVSENKLGGIQLFADKNWNSDFMTHFDIKSIPRFILIDPSGKVIKSDAERPSDPDLQQTLDSLLN